MAIDNVPRSSEVSDNVLESLIRADIYFDLTTDEQHRRDELATRRLLQQLGASLALELVQPTDGYATDGPDGDHPLPTDTI